MYDVWWLIGYIFVLVILSVIDIRRKIVPMWGILSTLLISMVVVCLKNEESPSDMFIFCISLVPGLSMVFISWVTAGKVGIGDGLLLIAIGMGIGFENCIYVLCVALIFSCIVSGILLVLKKANRNTHIPFVPFITLGMGVVMCGYI